MSDQPQKFAWDPLALAEQLQNIAKQSQVLMQRFVAAQADATKFGMGDTSTLGFDFGDLMSKVIADPTTVAKAQIDLFNDSVAIWLKKPLNVCSCCAHLTPTSRKISASSIRSGKKTRSSIS
jgi:hypothetical protein